MSDFSLIIDGYNLLHAAGMAREKCGHGDLQRARQRLLRLLHRHLSAGELSRTTVVFDARHPPPDLPHTWTWHGLKILFANPGGDADEVIEELIDVHPHPKKLLVISSDRRLRIAARRRGAESVDSDSFIEDMERRPLAAEERAEPAIADPRQAATVSEAELAHWLAVFGEVSELEEPPRARTGRQRATFQPPPAAPPAESGQASPDGRTTQAPVPAREATSSEPVLFSEEWIRRLQAWVDEQQG